MFRERNHTFDRLNVEWNDIYAPMSSINDRWYNTLMDMPSKDEWSNMIRDLNPHKAPGLSHIGYLLIKKANSHTQDLFRSFAFLCFNKVRFPKKWKIVSMYPIPKPREWNYDLKHTRPILLIECLRKCFMRILTKRLGRIMATHNILKGPNYAGLPGESTAAPIAIINGIIEDARDNKRTL